MDKTKLVRVTYVELELLDSVVERVTEDELRAMQNDFVMGRGLSFKGGTFFVAGNALVTMEVKDVKKE